MKILLKSVFKYSIVFDNFIDQINCNIALSLTTFSECLISYGVGFLISNAQVYCLNLLSFNFIVLLKSGLFF